MNIFSALKSMKSPTNNEKILIDYILKHPSEFLESSADKVCDECFVSVTTLYRLCRKLGCSGLSDFKVKVSGSINNYLKENTDFNYNYPINENQTHYEVIHNLKEDYDQTIISTKNLFDLEQIRLAVSKMAKSKQIDIYTSAGNIYFAENFKFQMQEIGILVNVPEEEYLQRITAASSDENHFAILISFGGRGVNALSIAKMLKHTHTPVLLISSIDENPLTPYASYHCFLCSHEDHYNKISSFSTRLSLLYILDVLYTCYFKIHYNENKEKKLKHYQSLVDFHKE